ncbi:MAG: LuxR C-terminal-related transcriptional regulator, partial [Streptosporangiaceae bacterium]
LTLSAREAERSLAFEDAAARYAQAADLLDGPEPDREELRLAAAHNYVRAGNFASARTVYLRLADSGDPRTRLRAAVGYEDAGWRPGRPGADACTLLTRALDDVPSDPTDAEYVRALATLGRAMAFTGDADRARALGEEALGYSRKLGDKRLLTDALQATMWHYFAPGLIGRQLAIADELAQLAREIGNWEALGMAAVFQSGIAYMHANPDAWADANADLDRAVRASGQPFLAYVRGCDDYARGFLRADFGAAERVAEDLLELGRSFGTDNTEGPYGLQMFMVRRETGALETVRPFVQAAAADPVWQPGLLALYTEFGNTDASRSLLHRLLGQVHPASGQPAPWSQWSADLVFLAEAAVALRDVGAARRIRPLLAPYTGLQLQTGPFVAVFGPADTYHASHDSVLGRHESAERLFARAHTQNRASGSVIHQAGTLAAWATHLRVSGRTSQRRFREVRDEARRLAATAGLARVLRTLGEGADHPAGLTPREVAVLQLLTGGSSNRDIAEKLKISENTAANHVRSILSKTGAANRTQVAMMAIAGQWVDSPAPQREPAGPL